MIVNSDGLWAILNIFARNIDQKNRFTTCAFKIEQINCFFLLSKCDEIFFGCLGIFLWESNVQKKASDLRSSFFFPLKSRNFCFPEGDKTACPLGNTMASVGYNKMSSTLPKNKKKKMMETEKTVKSTKFLMKTPKKKNSKITCWTSSAAHSTKFLTV